MKTPALAVIATMTTSGAVAQDISQVDRDWFTAGQDTIERRLALQPNINRVRNGILFDADGTGVATTSAIRLCAGQQAGARATIMSGPTRISPAWHWSGPTGSSDRPRIQRSPPRPC